MPEPSELKSKFNEKFETISAAKKSVESDIHRLKAEANSKRDHRKNVQQDLTTKEVPPFIYLFVILKVLHFTVKNMIPPYESETIIHLLLSHQKFCANSTLPLHKISLVLFVGKMAA